MQKQIIILLILLISFTIISCGEKSETISIIYIDDKSIDNIGSYPFSRDIYADLIRILKKANAKVIVLDLNFHGSHLKNPEKDADLAETIKDTDKVIFASVFTNDKVKEPEYMNLIKEQALTEIKGLTINTQKNTIKDDKFHLYSWNNIYFPYQEFVKNGAEIGLKGDVPKSATSESYFEVPFWVYEGDIFYSLPFVAFMKFKDLTQEDLEAKNPKNLLVNGKKILLTNQSEIVVNFDNKDAFPTYSLIDVLENKVDMENFANRIVLIGNNSPDWVRFKETKGGKIDGTKILACAIDTFLKAYNN